MGNTLPREADRLGRERMYFTVEQAVAAFEARRTAAG